ncbi:uncharacterized protein LOC131650923 [Vicia villosa]|uniref:uncharacterized protein LOC131650923 n=1 Tax=Vicia villosa TaxID=3911 RepID=UPI00273CD90A|nr:uncharacterized protein LOC131650923 [Vicia villosa]
MLVWRLLHNRIPTDENIAQRGLSFPSKISLCHGSNETTTHLFFECPYATNLWKWFNALLPIPSPISSLSDCLLMLKKAWSPQALAVLKARLVYILYQIWQVQNLHRFENKNIHWKTCISNIMAKADLVGNLSRKKADGSLHSFSFLKCFGVNLHPRPPSNTIDVIWYPPARGWMKCNIDGVAVGSPGIAACGGIFRDDQANHILSFSAFLEVGSSIIVEFLAAIYAIEKDKQMN